MKKMVCCASLLCFFFAASTSALGYIGKSIRIMGFGEHLAGVIKDEDTDIYRNPAYLSFVDTPRAFGQYNLFHHMELRIAENLTNKGTALFGFVIPTPSCGSFALVAELKPSTSEKKSSHTGQKEYVDYHVVDTSSSRVFDKKTIEGFKAVYSFNLSPSLRIGTDFTYLRNYDRRDSEAKSIFTHRSIASDELRYNKQYEDVRNSDDSPDAQRMSLGMVSTTWDKITLDLTLYYENLHYTKTASSRGESETDDLRTDTTTTVHLAWGASSGPTKNRTVGLDVNLKYHFPQKTNLAFLFGVRNGKNEFSWSDVSGDTSYSSKDVSRWGSGIVSVVHDDRTLSLATGIGVEKDFSPSVKVGAACRGHWNQEKLDRHQVSRFSSISTVGDSVTYRSGSSEEKRVKKTANSYELAFPIGAEIILHKTIEVRFGGAFIVKRDETETGHSTSSRDEYYQGIRLSYNERILLDAYIEDEITRLGNWMVKVEYRF